MRIIIISSLLSINLSAMNFAKICCCSCAQEEPSDFLSLEDRADVLLEKIEGLSLQDARAIDEILATSECDTLSEAKRKELADKKGIIEDYCARKIDGMLKATKL